MEFKKCSIGGISYWYEVEKRELQSVMIHPS